MNTVAIIVPHGDDEVLGFGGVIQKHVEAGDQVNVIFARRAIDKRTAKQTGNISDAKKVLGYQNGIVIGLTEKEMSHEPLKFFRKLETVLESICPNIVYTTFWGDIHQDHKIVFDWVCRAVRVHGPLNVKQFYLGEIPSSTDQRPPMIGDVFKPNHYVTLTEKEVKVKIEALQCYKTEIQSFPHPRSGSGVYSLAARRGSECNTDHAEAFMCLRNII